MLAAQQRGPTVWNMCRLLSGNGITCPIVASVCCWAGSTVQRPARDTDFVACSRKRSLSEFTIQRAKCHERRHPHRDLRDPAARSAVWSGDLFRNAPPPLRPDAHGGQDFSLPEVRLRLHGRRGRGPLALLAMRQTERADCVLNWFR